MKKDYNIVSALKIFCSTRQTCTAPLMVYLIQSISKS